MEKFNENNEEIIEQLSDRISKCIDLIWFYGHLKEKKYKSWLIDQILRNLIADEDAYNEWINKYHFDEETKEKSGYIWDKGVEPE